MATQTSIYGKIRITFGEKPSEENINKHIININKLLKDISIIDYVAGLEQSKKGVWHSQGILEIDISGATTTIANKSLLHKTKNGNKFNRSYTQYVKEILDISGSGNKSYSLTPIKHDKVADYKSYCAKEGWRLAGNPSVFEELRQSYEKKLKDKKDASNKIEREKRERRQKIVSRYTEEYIRLNTSHIDTSGLNISNLAKTQNNDIRWCPKVFESIMIEVYYASSATLYASSIHKHHQDILKVCKQADYNDYIRDLIQNTITQRQQIREERNYLENLQSKYTLLKHEMKQIKKPWFQ